MGQIRLDDKLPVDSNNNPVQGALDASGNLVPLNINASGELVVSGGGSSGGSGVSSGTTSSVLIGSDIGTYTFDASAQTITISGTKTFKIEEVLSIINVTDQEIIYSPADVDKGATIASNVITLEYDTTSMDDADDLQIYMQYNNSQDYSLNQQKVGVQNPEWAHYTSTEHIIDEANVAASTYREIINQEEYRNGVLHLNVSGGVTVTVRASLDDTADDSADTGWIDVSSQILGAGSLVDSSGIYFIDTSMMPDRFMIKYTTSDTSNAIDGRYKKF